jgi:hypothetical protein
MPKHKIYLSGKITGMENEAHYVFQNAEENLQKLYPDSEIINPMKLNHSHNKKWESYMKVCIIELCKCDMIAMLPNWQDSRGAEMEMIIASNLNLHVEFL